MADKIEITGIYLIGQNKVWEVFVELPDGKMKKAFDAADLAASLSSHVDPKELRDTPDQSLRWKPFLKEYPSTKRN